MVSTVNDKEVSQIDGIFKQSWVDSIKQAGIFASDDSEDWRITENNYSEVLRALNMVVTHFSKTLHVEISLKDSGYITYSEFCTLFKKEFAKAAQL